MTYDDLQAALKELDLPEQATLKVIRQRHRELVRRYHPDSSEGDAERMQRINAAYRIISEYIRQYRFDFSRKSFMAHYPEERLREQFGGVDMWGDRPGRRKT